MTGEELYESEQNVYIKLPRRNGYSEYLRFHNQWYSRVIRRDEDPADIAFVKRTLLIFDPEEEDMFIPLPADKLADLMAAVLTDTVR